MGKSSLNGKRANEKSSSSVQGNGQSQTDANGSLNSSNNSDGVIRVGSLYQAQVQAWDPTERREPPVREEEWRLIDENGTCCVWYPPKDRTDQTNGISNNVSDQDIQNFEREAVDTYGFKPEQALGLLMYHHYDVNLAKDDLPAYRPNETGIDSWDADDRIIFETAYRLHAKSFLKIQETLPNKKIADLVAYYYRWKKTQNGGVSLGSAPAKSSKSKEDPKSKTKAKHLERHTFSGPRSVLWADNDQHDYATILTPTMIGQILEEKLNTTEWQVKEQAVEKKKKIDHLILSSTARIQKAKQSVELEQENNPVDLHALRKKSSRPSVEICTDFKAEEVFLLGIGIQECGSNWERIVKICLPNKTPESLSAFYEMDKTSNKFNMIGYMEKFEKTQKNKTRKRKEN